MSLTSRDNFIFVKNVMTFKTCPLVRIGPKLQNKMQISSENMRLLKSSVGSGTCKLLTNNLLVVRKVQNTFVVMTLMTPS